MVDGAKHLFDPNRLTTGLQHAFEVEVYLHGLEPEMVRVELYADGIGDDPPVRQEMTPIHSPEGPSAAHIYSTTVPGDRPSSDYTARVIPGGNEISIPLEDARILWQR